MPRAIADMLTLIVFVVVSLGIQSLARAQCEPVWQSFDPTTARVSGTNGTVNAVIMWDPDGPGPDSAKLVVGGSFTIASTVLARNIAIYDPASGVWSTLGTGTNGSVLSFAVLPNGNLVAGGEFTTAGGVVVNGIATWNGSAWSALSTGVSQQFPASVNALVTLPNGDLVAGGNFTSAGGTSARSIARWNGTSWLPLGTGIGGFDPRVLALAVLPNGDLIAGGSFGTAGGVTALRVARWNGSAWFPLGEGIRGDSSGLQVLSLAVLPNGDLAAGGIFSTAYGSSQNHIARWNGSSWSAFGSGMTSNVAAMAVLPNGDLVAGGQFLAAGGVNANYIARWNGTAWSAFGSGMSSEVRSLAILPSGDLLAAGGFQTAGAAPARSLASWNGSAWTALAAPGLPTGLRTLHVLRSGDLLAGGEAPGAPFTIFGVIRRWNGSDWSDYLFFNSTVLALAERPNGEVVAGGWFTPGRIARWNGTTGSGLGSGMNNTVFTLAVLPNGHVVAGGSFTSAGGVSGTNRIARWTGATWVSFGASGVGGNVDALAVLPNGNLVAAGDFAVAGLAVVNRIARWSGSAWSALASGMNGRVLALAVLPNGDLIAGGEFGTAGGVASNRIARWDGSAWSPLGSGMNGAVHELIVLPNGDLVAGGLFTTAGGVNANNIARWDGVAWRPLGTGLDGGVGSLALLPNGDLVALGGFSSIGSSVALGIARYGPPRIFITDQPDNVTIDAGQNLVLAAATNPGLSNITVQWQRNGVNITNGPAGASPGGGFVSGAAGPLPSPTTGAPMMLTITGAQPGDSGQYTAVFTSACDSVTSSVASVAVIAVPVFRCTAADIAYDDGTPLPPIGPYGPQYVNNGVTEADYNLFFAIFFDGGLACDIADDTGQPLPPFGNGGQPPFENSGVNKGDYDLFFSIFFDGCEGKQPEGRVVAPRSLTDVAKRPQTNAR
ncbi:MAG: hypothetical protein K2X32_05030 [Phycisphaerales bacterium]|nr:hypothetical protein [Phycisphaerales bacterium]